MWYTPYLFQPHGSPGFGRIPCQAVFAPAGREMAGMMSENLWPPHAIPRLPSKAAPTWVRASSAGPRPNCPALTIFPLRWRSRSNMWRRLGMTGGGSSSLGLVRLTLANLPNHPHNPQPSNPPPPTTASFSSQSPPPLASLVSHSGSLKSPPKLSCSHTAVC